MRKYNKEQKAYLDTKNALEILEAKERALEEEFVRNLDVINKDGSIPTRTWTIDNDEIADKAIEDFGKIEDESGLWVEILKAKEAHKKAEEALVQYAISLVPFKKERETLKKAATIYKYRMEILENVLCLDASTVKMIAR